MGSLSLAIAPSTPPKYQSPPCPHSLAMAETSVLSSLKELINDEVFIDKAQDLARGTAIAAVLLLMFLLFGDESKLGGISSGYGTALSKSYDTEDAIIELQQQIAELQDRVIGETSGKPDAYNSFDYSSSSFSS